MSSRARWLLQGSWLLSLQVALIASPAWAADDAARGAARKLAQAGVEEYQERKYELASEKLERAYSVLPVPSIGLWSARALERRGKLVEASERYLETTRLDAAIGEVAVQRRARAEAEAERQALLARIPTLLVYLAGVAPEQTQVTIDGVPWPSALLGEPRPTNPGSHELRAQHADQVVTLQVTLAEGDKKEEILRFTAPVATAPPAAVTPAAVNVAPATPPASSSQRTLAFVALGVGGAGLLTSAITGGMVASRHGDLESSCNERDQCDPGRQSDVDSYNSLRTISTVSLIAGGVFAATGVTLLLTAPRQSEHAELLLDGSSVRLRGRF